MLMRPPVSLLQCCCRSAVAAVTKVDVIQFVLRCPAAACCVEGRKAAVADLNCSCFATKTEWQIPQPVYITLKRVAHTLKTCTAAAGGPGCRLSSVRLKVCLAYCRVLGSSE